MVWSANVNSTELDSLLHDTSPVCSRIYQREAPGHVTLWEP